MDVLSGGAEPGRDVLDLVGGVGELRQGGGEQAAVDAAAAEAGGVVLDLREVTFIDSAGLRLVLQSARAIEPFSVVRGPQEVQRVFDLVGLDARLTGISGNVIRDILA